MGGLFSSAIDKLFGKKEYRVLMLGLDNAGKSTTLYKLKLGEVVNTVPTIGFNVEEVEYRNVKFNCWDVGGQTQIRRLWRHYYAGTDALIYVVDSADTDRVEEATEELAHLLAQDELKDAAVVVFANKQDLPGAMNTTKLAEKLGLHGVRGREWYIQGCCANTGEGLHEGLDWMVDTLKKASK